MTNETSHQKRMGYFRGSPKHNLDADRRRLESLLELLPSDWKAIQEVRTEPFDRTFILWYEQDLRSFISEYDRAEDRFLNQEIEALRIQLQKNISVLLSVLDRNTTRLAAGEDRHKRTFPFEPIFEEVQRKREELSQAADNVCEAYDAFVERCEKELGCDVQSMQQSSCDWLVD